MLNNKNINLALITIGDADWKKVVKDIYESLRVYGIEENEYRIARANDEFNYKMIMDNKELPSFMTNEDLHLKDGFKFRLTIAMPFNSTYIDNDELVLTPWFDEEMNYKLASRICCERVVIGEYANCVLILCGDNLSEEEIEFSRMIMGLCEEYDKKLYEIGEDCIMSFSRIVKWLESGENYTCYNGNGIMYKVS